jgi:hypothetical protein
VLDLLEVSNKGKNIENPNPSNIPTNKLNKKDINILIPRRL